MAQVPECVVCLQPYDDFLHVPRVLACGHSFCELCLMQLQSAWQSSSSSPANNDKNNNNDSPAAARGAMIRCPECSHRTRLPVGGQQSLPKNVELLRLLPSLIREADATTTGRDSGETSSASPLKASVQGNGNSNNRAAAVTGRREGHHLNAADSGGGAGTRSGAYSRRPKAEGKGRQRVDSNADSGSSGSGVDRSWLLPFDLYSENSNKNRDMRAWILPDKAIKLRGVEEDSSSRVTVLDSHNLYGEILLERDRLSSSVPVRLRQLTEVNCASHPQQDHQTTNMSYEDCVLKAWEGCHYEVQTELLILFRVSLLTRGLCKLFGVWMNRQRNALYVVTQTLAQDENISAWEMVKKSFQQRKEWSSDFKSETDERSSTSSLDSAVSVPSAAPDMTVPAELRNAALAAEQKFPSSTVVEQMLFSRVGLELCGTLCEVHSQGLIFGLLSPNCFALDRIGSLLIDLNAALNERSSLRDATTRFSNSNGKFNSEGGGACGILNKAPLDDFLKQKNYRNSCWRYMSPEALSLLIPSNANKTTVENDASSSSSSSEKLQNRFTCQTDVWSLGCLFLELLSGKAPYEGFTFQEVLHKVLVEREKPGNFLNLLDSGADCIKDLAVLLSKCFEYDPDERPQLDVLYRNLMEFGVWSNVATPTSRTSSTPPEQQHLQSETAADSTANQKYWVLCLPGFVRDGYPDSWHGNVADVQESQGRLSLLMFYNATAADDGRELQPRGLEQKGSLEGHQDYVTALAVCGDYLLSASFDKTIRVWSLEDHAWQQTLRSHSYTIVALAVDHNTSRCFSGDTGGKICAWDIGEDTPEHPLVTTWQEHDDWRYTGVASLAVSADGILYSGSGDRTVKAWSLQNFNLLGIMEGHKGLVSSLLVDGELLYSGSWDGTIHVWWRNDQSIVAVLGGGTTLNPSLGGVRTLCMFDSFLFAGRDNGAIQVWRDEECLTTVKAHDTVVSTLYVEGDFLYTGSWDEQIKAWKVDKFLSDPSPTLERHCGSALSSVVSDGEQLYAGLADRAIKVYSLLGDTWASLVQML